MQQHSSASFAPPTNQTGGGASSRSTSALFAHPFFPWRSFVGLFDLKQGCEVISLFALFNKIAGVYGILAVFSGGTAAQVSLYVYSIVSIGALLWGIRAISDESAKSVMLYSHFFTLDHLLSSVWTFYFAYLTFTSPHDGERPPLAEHQQGLMELIEHLEEEYEIPGKVQHHVPLTGAARIEGANKVWNEESGFAAGVLLAGWVLKIFFALTLYSYALHLRHNTYANLPLAKSSLVDVSATGGASSYQLAPTSDRPRGNGYSDGQRELDGDEDEEHKEYERQTEYSTDGHRVLSRGLPRHLRASNKSDSLGVPGDASGSSAGEEQISGSGDATGSRRVVSSDRQAGGSGSVLGRRATAGPASPASPSQSFFRSNVSGS